MAKQAPCCRFVQIADVHYVMPPHPRLDWPQLAERLPQQVRVTEMIDTMLPLALAQIHADLQPDFIIYTGDQVNAGWDEAGLANQQGFQALLAECDSDGAPVYCTFGNHDRPRERFLELYGTSTYSFACNGCHFAVLDSGLMNEEQGIDPPEIFDAGLQELRDMLASADGAPAAVILHFYLYPSDLEGYSYRAAHEAIEIIKSYGRRVPVLDGHYHAGRVDVVNNAPYFTARSFIESPFAFYLHELTDERLVINEYCLDLANQRWSGYRKCVFELGGLS